MTRRLLVTAVAAALVAGCGSSSKSTPPTGAAVFTNSSYVDFDPMKAPSAAASNLVATLAYQPVPVTEFTGTVAGDVKMATAGRKVLAFPWQAIYLDPDVDQATRDQVKAFTAAGGTTMFFWLDTGSLALVNDTFGWSLAEGTTFTSLDVISLDAAAAAGTPFAGGPATLEAVDTTNSVTVASLPAGARVVYGDGAGDAAVTVIPVGSGRVVLYGWDWTDAFPTGGQDGGWLEALRRGTSF